MRCVNSAFAVLVLFLIMMSSCMTVHAGGGDTVDMYFSGTDKCDTLNNHTFLMNWTYDGKKVMSREYSWSICFGGYPLKDVHKDAELDIYIEVYDPQGNQVAEKRCRHLLHYDTPYECNVSGNDWYIHLRYELYTETDLIAWFEEGENHF